MNKKNLLCVVKNMTAGVLATGLIVAGILVLPKQADAAVVEDKVIYEEGYDIKKYWDAENPKAPVKEGYVFGGWYSEKEENAYLTYENAKSAETAYAKFVPAQVLSVKAQNMADTTADTPTTYVRVISSLDSKNYSKVGFDIYLANSVKLYKNNDTQAKEPLETDKIYDGVLVGKNKQEKRAVEIFGGVSKYVSVWQLTGIANAHFQKIIYVRPYWITPDGTKVLGLAKYVHIEDEYKGYVCVPVNVSRTEGIAAGSVTMNCRDLTLTQNEGKVYLGEAEVLFEPGRIFTNMRFNGKGETIKMVGYESKVATDNNSDETIFANIRFKESELTQKVNFDMTLTKFCNWAEELVDNMKVWDIKYEVKTTTNK